MPVARSQNTKSSKAVALRRGAGGNETNRKRERVSYLEQVRWGEGAYGMPVAAGVDPPGSRQA